MTKVSATSSSGETVRVARERVREGSKEREHERSPWRGEATGRGAVPGTEPFTPLGMPRFERSAEQHREDWGHALCLVGR